MKIFAKSKSKNSNKASEPKEWYIDDDAIQRDLRILLQSDRLAEKWEGLIAALKENPYKLPNRYTPRDGLLMKGKKYHGQQLYHAVIDKSEKERLFYIVNNGRVIFSDIEYKGIVELIQSLGHDFNR